MTLILFIAPVVVIISLFALAYVIWSHEEERWTALEEYAKGISTNAGRHSPNDVTHNSGGQL